MSRKLAIDENIGIIHSCLQIGCSRHPHTPPSRACQLDSLCKTTAAASWTPTLWCPRRASLRPRRTEGNLRQNSSQSTSWKKITSGTIWLNIKNTWIIMTIACLIQSRCRPLKQKHLTEHRIPHAFGTEPTLNYESFTQDTIHVAPLQLGMIQNLSKPCPTKAETYRTNVKHI